MPKAAMSSQPKTRGEPSSPYHPLEYFLGSADLFSQFDPAPLDSGDIDGEQSGNGDAHIPRPQNMFMLFRTEMCNRGIPELSAMRTVGEKSRLISQLWHSLSPKEKEYWKKRADIEREEHEKKYPGYKYQPKPRGSKSAQKLQHPKKGPKSANGSISQVMSPQSSSSTHQTPLPQKPSTAAPFYDTSFFQPESDPLQANWFDLADLDKSVANLNWPGHASFGDNYSLTDLHATNQLLTPSPASSVGRPVMPLYPQTDMYGRVSGSMLMSNGNRLELQLGSPSQPMRTVGGSTFPTTPNAYASNAIAHSNLPALPSRPYWDFVTPDEPIQAGAWNSTGPF